MPERQSRDWRSSRTAARLEAPVPAAVGSVCDPPGVDPGDLPARMPRRQAESHASLPPCRPARRPARLVTTPPRSCHRRRLHTHGDQRLQHRRLCCVRPGHVQEHARSLLQGGAAALSRVRCQRVRPSRRISVPLHVRHAARGRADPAACLSHARARNAGGAGGQQGRARVRPVRTARSPRSTMPCGPVLGPPMPRFRNPQRSRGPTLPFAFVSLLTLPDTCLPHGPACGRSAGALRDARARVASPS